jgi:hypothetical protein
LIDVSLWLWCDLGKGRTDSRTWEGSGIGFEALPNAHARTELWSLLYEFQKKRSIVSKGAAKYRSLNTHCALPMFETSLCTFTPDVYPGSFGFFCSSYSTSFSTSLGEPCSRLLIASVHHERLSSRSFLTISYCLQKWILGPPRSPPVKRHRL